jgi:F-type H+-transporting ATPase subunit a
MFFSPLEQFNVFLIDINNSLFTMGPFFSNFVVYNGIYAGVLLGLIGLIIWYLPLLSVVNRVILSQGLIALLSLVVDNATRFGSLFFVYFLALSSFLFLSNFFGLFPYAFTLTSQLICTFTLSFIFFFAINFIALMRHLYKVVSLFLPAGTPFPIMPLIVPIEILSYLSRLFSLAIRLFANMMSGHTLLHILLSFLYKLFFSALFFFLFLFLPLLIIQCVLFMEIGISLLQIYVFVSLSSLYLNDTTDVIH